MSTALKVAFLLLLTSAAVAQTTVPAAPPQTGSTSMTSILPDLDRLQAAATQSTADLSHMRIDKWKADPGSKQQAQANSESIQRNLTSALPGLISDVRSAPQDLNAEFKLYRNLNVLYDVFASVTESTGAFGVKSDYDALAQQLGVIDSVRHNLANALESLTASTQAEVNQLRTQNRALQQAAVAAPPPKKVVVDDNEPVKKTTHKKKPATSPGSSTASPSSNSSSSAPAAATKSQ